MQLFLLCDFHREQAWERWTSKKDNGVSQNKETLLGLMRQIARSRTHESFERSLQSLRETPFWKANTNLRRWFENTWLKHKQACKKFQLCYVWLFIGDIK